MSTKYNRLTKHLANLDDTRWTATFDQIERILGFPLPESARTYQAWWSNQMRSQSMAWQSASWKTAALDLDNERITFVYIGGDENGGDARLAASEGVDAAPLTIAEAKAGLAATFGLDPAQIDITIRA